MFTVNIQVQITTPEGVSVWENKKVDQTLENIQSFILGGNKQIYVRFGLYDLKLYNTKIQRFTV